MDARPRREQFSISSNEALFEGERRDVGGVPVNDVVFTSLSVPRPASFGIARQWYRSCNQPPD